MNLTFRSPWTNFVPWRTAWASQLNCAGDVGLAPTAQSAQQLVRHGVKLWAVSLSPSAAHTNTDVSTRSVSWDKIRPVLPTGDMALGRTAPVWPFRLQPRLEVGRIWSQPVGDYTTMGRMRLGTNSVLWYSPSGKVYMGVCVHVGGSLCR